MQRRLTIALVATALVSIVLVGFGVLAIAQLGARNNAEDDVRRGLNVLGDLLGSSDRSGRQVEGLLLGTRRDLGLSHLEPVVVTDQGVVRSLAERQRRPEVQATELPSLSLTPAELGTLAEGRTVTVSADRVVFGLRALPADLAPGRDGVTVALLAGQRISAVSRQTVAWFVLSSGVVLLGALGAGLALAKRLTGPLKEIEATTSAIAGGDLDARVRVTKRDEVGDLGHAVNEMAADLQRSKALDRQFLMSVSHDLRTPLTAISGYAEGLRDGAVTDPRAAGEIIGNHAARLDHLVGDLLDLARLDANRFRLATRPFDLAVVAGRTVAGLVNRAEQQGLALTSGGAPSAPVTADPDRTAQAIANLIDNALKFARSQVRVEVGAVDGWAVVAVRDDGPGIPEADLPHIFDRLYTGADQPATAENPTGLGLAIVRELTAAMGGWVAADNDPAGGARLALALPLTGQPGSPPPGQHHRTGSANGDDRDRTTPYPDPAAPPDQVAPNRPGPAAHDPTARFGGPEPISSASPGPPSAARPAQPPPRAPSHHRGAPPPAQPSAPPPASGSRGQPSPNGATGQRT